MKADMLDLILNGKIEFTIKNVKVINIFLKMPQLRQTQNSQQSLIPKIIFHFFKLHFFSEIRMFRVYNIVTFG